MPQTEGFYAKPKPETKSIRFGKIPTEPALYIIRQENMVHVNTPARSRILVVANQS